MESGSASGSLRLQGRSPAHPRVAALLLLAAIAVLAALAVPLAAQAPAEPAKTVFTLGGLLAATAQTRFDPFEPFFSLRAIPKLDFSMPAGSGRTFDGEASADIYGALTLPNRQDADLSGDIKPYRVWLRFSTSRSEVRLGLQQIDFGPAILFRPLMWFDSLDPRDPLQLTDGVYGLLVRLYAKNNANAWLWGLYGNSERRGFDLAPPDKKAPEFGGRVEVPLFKGELAATFHHRKAEIGFLAPLMSPLLFSPFSSSAISATGPPLLKPLCSPLAVSPLIPFDPSPGDPSFVLTPPILRRAPDQPSDIGLLIDPGSVSPLPSGAVPEDRFGLDGKWDIGIGVWFEAALIHQRTPFLPLPYQRAWTLGADYTFSVGRGLRVLAEHFRIDSAPRAFAGGAGLTFSGLLVRYPIGLLDELSAIFYYDWTDRGLYRFAGWTRRTDTVTFSAMAFWNPTELPLFRGLAGSGSFAGIGLELILAYNF